MRRVMMSGLVAATLAVGTAHAALPAVADDSMPRGGALGLTYDRDNDLYVLVSENASGEIDVHHGRHGAWTKLQENRDIDNRYNPAEFVDVALRTPNPDGSNHGLAIGAKNGRCTSINAREFSNKPYFGDGRPEPIN